jgi:prepilin-type N-terminal cleavage/methylation domain-containing protein
MSQDFFSGVRTGGGVRRMDPHARRPGFTLVELMMGLVITSLVMGALAALSFAMSRAWSQSESGQSSSISSHQAAIRLQNFLRQAKLVGLVRAGSTNGSMSPGGCAMLWLRDDNADGKVQLTEIGLIEHDLTQKRVKLYQVKVPSGMTADAYNTANPVTSVAVTDSAAPENFKALATVWAQPLAGADPATVNPHAVRVSGFRIEKTGGTGSQGLALQFTLVLTKDGNQDVSYGAAVLRSATTQPAN